MLFYIKYNFKGNHGQSLPLLVQTCFSSIIYELSQKNLPVLLISNSSQEVVACLLDSESFSQFLGRAVFLWYHLFPPGNSYSNSSCSSNSLLCLSTFTAGERYQPFRFAHFFLIICLLSCFQARQFKPSLFIGSPQKGQKEVQRCGQYRAQIEAIIYYSVTCSYKRQV